MTPVHQKRETLLCSETWSSWNSWVAWNCSGLCDFFTDLFHHYCEWLALQICLRWDDEAYFILIQVFIVAIQGKDNLLGPPVCATHCNHTQSAGAILTVLNVQDVMPVQHPPAHVGGIQLIALQRRRPLLPEHHVQAGLVLVSHRNWKEWRQKPVVSEVATSVPDIYDSGDIQKTVVDLLARSVRLWFSPAGMVLEDLRGSPVTPAQFKFDALTARLSVLSCVNLNRPWLE